MSNARIKPDVKPLRKVMMRDLMEELSLEKSNSRSLKFELARLRAGLADVFYQQSEQVLGEKEPT